MMRLWEAARLAPIVLFLSPAVDLILQLCNTAQHMLGYLDCWE